MRRQWRAPDGEGWLELLECPWCDASWVVGVIPDAKAPGQEETFDAPDCPACGLPGVPEDPEPALVGCERWA